jgi:YegS/Rv2252/BmrU family lipid kinase
MQRLGITPEVAYTTGPGHAVELARGAAASGRAPIVGVGGDGTLHEIVNGLLAVSNPSAALGVIPAGTADDFAHTHGLPRIPEAAAEGVVTGAERRIDVGMCGDRYFLNAGGVGFDAQVAATVNTYRPAWMRGALPYVLGTLFELGRYRNRDLEIHLDDRVLRQRCLLVAVANGCRYGGGMLIAPPADPSDGLLDVCVGGDFGRWEAVAMLRSVFSGAHLRHPKVALYRSREVRIVSTTDARVQADGEDLGRAPASFKVCPGALRLLAPP